MRALFISDCHLSPDKPALITRFKHLLKEQAPGTDAIYILGDLFDYWVGDDIVDPGLLDVLDALNTASNQTSVYFLHGNRDFLIGKTFAEKTNCTLLEQPTVIKLQGSKTLIMHGDSLCTDDYSHQWWRRITQHNMTKALFNRLSPQARLYLAKKLKQACKKSAAKKPQAITDVNENTVISYMQKFAVTQLIHGHTHRPNIHQVALNHTTGKRIVLGSWDLDGSILSVDDHTMELIATNTS